MTYTIGIIIFSVIAGILMAVFSIPFWFFVVTILIIGLIRLAYIFFILYYIQNPKLIQGYLKSNKRHTLYAYALTLPNGSKSEQIQAIDKILAKYPSPLMQATYGANRAILQMDFEAAKKAIEPIKDQPLGQYTLALIQAFQGNQNDANSFRLSKKWMKPLIEAVLAFQDGDRIRYEEFREEALKHARGIQHYTIYHFFLRIGEQ
ncbi:hypothetical protein [Lysinibacillus sp. 54212]|uniref:hypothetical protein n=1 Tax=Lysinibacillus sp. 54212 TaxID=3119829 RepID=UPI002FC64FDF